MRFFGKSCGSYVAGLLWLLLVFSSALRADPVTRVPPLEYQVKASLIYNFLNYFEWPQESFEAHPEELWVCVIGGAPFGRALSRIDGELAKGKRIRVERSAVLSSRHEKFCNVMYFSPGYSVRLPETGIGSVLTIGDGAEFIRSGGVIGFVIRDGKMRFEINAGMAKASRLVVSSHLLRLAERVI